MEEERGGTAPTSAPLQHAASIDSVHRAVDRVDREASPARLHAVREILTSVLATSGDRLGAATELDLLDSDPLGLTISRSGQPIS